MSPNDMSFNYILSEYWPLSSNCRQEGARHVTQSIRSISHHASLLRRDDPLPQDDWIYRSDAGHPADRDLRHFVGGDWSVPANRLSPRRSCGGRQDRSIPFPHARAMPGILQSSRLSIVDEAGHSLNDERADCASPSAVELTASGARNLAPGMI
jgi:hypothetical protein